MFVSALSSWSGHKLQHQWAVAWKRSACGLCWFHMHFRSGMLAGQSRTVILWTENHLEVVYALWAGAKVLMEKEISISIKLVSRWKHKVLQNPLVDSCTNFGLDKTEWTNTCRHHSTPNHPGLQKLHTGLQAAWILCLSTLPPDSGTLISKWNTKLTFIWKEDFGQLSNSPVIFLFSPGKMLLTMFLFQKWLGSPFPEDVWTWWLLMHWLQLQFTLCESLKIGFAWQYSQACSHPCCLCTLHLICFDTALLEQPPLSVMTLCVLPSLWRVSMIIFWTIAKSAVFPVIVLSKNKRYNLYCMDGHL